MAPSVFAFFWKRKADNQEEKGEFPLTICRKILIIYWTIKMGQYEPSQSHKNMKMSRVGGLFL